MHGTLTHSQRLLKMENERQPLIKSLVDTFQYFKERKSVGRMRTEHSVFIPSELMVNSAKETEEFIKAAKQINKHREWKCPVSVEQANIVKVSGVEFVFEFTPETDFNSIIEFLKNY
jgi:pentose-5-phosphate-3-epimerase